MPAIPYQQVSKNVMKIVVQYIRGGYVQIDLRIVEDTQLMKDLLLADFSDAVETKVQKVGWINVDRNGVEILVVHMPTEWIPGNNPIPDPFETKKFYEKTRGYQHA